MVKRNRIFLLLLMSLFSGFTALSDCFGQPDYNSLYYYRFYLKDKGGADREEIPVADILSAKSLARRAKNGITTDFNDIPVHRPYIDTIVYRGLKISCRSRWMNTITASSTSALIISEYTSLPFIDSILLVKSPGKGKGEAYNKLLEEHDSESPPPYYWQLELHGVDKLHMLGARGEGIVIAILDGGFTDSDLMESVSEISSGGRILSTYDFVLGNEYVYDFSQHGSAVFSILGGDNPGQITGSAPGASYILLRSEDGFSEYLIEEDFWVAAAEYADSAGADIITTSLGYSIFTDSSMNYSYYDMDGESSFISRGADIAFSRGIVVVTSAGNERDDPWYYITAPADSREIIAVGAIDGNSLISEFSSSGPTYDNRIKPDVLAMGVAVTIERSPGVFTTGNGTSYACPLLSGMIACLMQLVPEASHREIRDAVKISADRYFNPDNLYGYGVANIYNAYNFLIDTKRSNNNFVHIYPNPSMDHIYIRINEEIQYFRVKIYDTTGRIVFNREYNNINFPIISIPEFSNLDEGAYMVNVSSVQFSSTRKIIKLKR